MCQASIFQWCRVATLLKSQNIHQISNDKFVTLNFVNELGDKDDELVSQSFMQTNFRQIHMDLS